ncbi:MAG: ABC-type branched-chain amino acid transport system, ATPase component, partial [Acidimicrobiia bacterium]|nr:ABC-type branched-chain amino acid transport system, ATPase component [Acidimicrobiia bacterium]
ILFEHGYVDLVPAMLIAIAAGIVLSLATGIPSIRLSSWTLGLVSFFLVLLLPGVVNIFKSQTGGLDGIPGLLNPTFLGIDVGSSERYYVLTIALVFTWTVALRNLLRSRFGLALQNMREGTLLAPSLGVPVVQLRLFAYAISSIPAAIAGCIYAYYARFVSPESFQLDILVAVIAAAVVGGLGSIYGPIVGAALLVLGPLRASSFKDYSLIVYGGFLVFVAVVFPTGVAGAFKTLVRYLRNRSNKGRTQEETEVRIERGERPDLSIPGERLEVSKINKSFGGVHVLRDVSLYAEPGTVTAIIGPNGAGKTTLLNTISGFIQGESGTVSIGGKQTSGLSAADVAHLGVGRTFQTPIIPHSISVLEVVASGRLTQGRLGMPSAVLRLPKYHNTRRTDLAASREVLKFAGMGRLADQDAMGLPLGTRRLLEVVRAVVAKPHVILLDEPAAGLDDDGLEELGDLIEHMRNAGATVVLVEHNVPFVLKVADLVHVLDFGEVISTGTPEHVRNDPRVIACYLGGPRHKKDERSGDPTADEPPAAEALAGRETEA